MAEAAGNDLFTAADHADDGQVHILLGASGSVATIKLPLIAEALGSHSNVSIRIILTDSAAKFLNGQSPEQPTLAELGNIKGVDAVYRDNDEWDIPWTRGAPILHIELRKWAHLLLVAPLSANSLAKMTMGFSDNLLLSVIRAWDTTGTVDVGVHKKKRKPRIFVAMAMNTAMWNHPVTEKQKRVLREEWGCDGGDGEGSGWVEVLEPMEKELACGDVGQGAMLDWRKIVVIIEEYAGLAK